MGNQPSGQVGPGTVTPLATAEQPLAEGARVDPLQQARLSYRPYRAAPMSLVARDGGRPLPLRSMSVHGRVTDLCAELVIKQTFVHPSTSAEADDAQPLECVYTFPAEDHVAGSPLAVCGIEVETTDGRHVVGRIQTTARARDTYGIFIFF